MSVNAMCFQLKKSNTNPQRMKQKWKSGLELQSQTIPASVHVDFNMLTYTETY